MIFGSRDDDKQTQYSHFPQELEFYILFQDFCDEIVLIFMHLVRA